jgi:hypothetical protein
MADPGTRCVVLESSKYSAPELSATSTAPEKYLAAQMRMWPSKFPSERWQGAVPMSQTDLA